MSENTSKQFFPALTSFRAFVAWMIFFYHFFPFKNPNIPLFIKNIVSQFHIGVDLFFVLSGVLITYRYFNDAPIHFKKYLINRFSRIYPMYFLLTIATFLVKFFQQGWTTLDSWAAVFSFTLTKALFTTFRYSGISQGWTLTFEELFYFSTPLFFMIIRKYRKAIYLLPVVIFLCTLGIQNLFHHPENTYGFLQTRIAVFIFEFFAGILAGYLLLHKKLKFHFNIFTYLGIAGILYYLLFRQFWQHLITNPFSDALDIILLSTLGIGPTIYGLATEKTKLSRFLSQKTLILLGKSSYIFYLVHKGFIPIFIYDHIVANILAIFVILNIISIILFKFIEEPLNLWIRKKYAK